MALKTTRWDAAETLDTKDDVVAVLGDIARSKGMTEIAKAAGLARSNLYKALSPHGNPEFATVANVLKALGLRLSVARERVSKRRVPPRRGAAGHAIRKSA